MDEDTKNYLSGVGIAMIGTTCSAIGLTCQKATVRSFGGDVRCADRTLFDRL